MTSVLMMSAACSANLSSEAAPRSEVDGTGSAAAAEVEVDDDLALFLAVAEDEDFPFFPLDSLLSLDSWALWRAFSNEVE